MTPLFDKQFVVVAGKGGVGRTTVSIILGICASRAGKRVLVCLANAPLRYSELLGGVSLGREKYRVSDNLDIVNLDPIASREEYGLQVLPNKTLHRILFGSKVVNAFLDALPGLAEWAMLGKATYHALNTVNGSPEYDIVFFDSPATGHGLDILSLPNAIVESIPSGRIREEALQRVELMTDSSRCEVIPVTVPEEMPVNEVLELITAVREKNLAVDRVIVNMVSDFGTPPEVKDLIRSADERGERPRWLAPASVEVARSRVLAKSLSRLDEKARARVVKMPMIKKGGLDEASLLKLVVHIEELIKEGKF